MTLKSLMSVERSEGFLHQAGLAELNLVVDLFDLYREFYEQASDRKACEAFIHHNISTSRSEVFLWMTEDGQALALAQFYRRVCSVSLTDFVELSDLYVRPEARRQGHAAQFLQALARHYSAFPLSRITLETAHDNLKAQALYHACDFKPEKMFQTWHLSLK